MKENIKAIEAVETWTNGNITDFKDWLKKAKKIDILDAIEHYSGNYGGRHVIIGIMRIYLTERN